MALTKKYVFSSKIIKGKFRIIGKWIYSCPVSELMYSYGKDELEETFNDAFNINEFRNEFIEEASLECQSIEEELDDTEEETFESKALSDYVQKLNENTVIIDKEETINLQHVFEGEHKEEAIDLTELPGEEDNTNHSTKLAQNLFDLLKAKDKKEEEEEEEKEMILIKLNPTTGIIEGETIKSFH